MLRGEGIQGTQDEEPLPRNQKKKEIFSQGTEWPSMKTVKYILYHDQYICVNTYI